MAVYVENPRRACAPRGQVEVLLLSGVREASPRMCESPDRVTKKIGRVPAEGRILYENLDHCGCSGTGTDAWFETGLVADWAPILLKATPQETNFEQWSGDHRIKDAQGMLGIPLTEEGVVPVTDTPPDLTLPYQFYLKAGSAHGWYGGGHMDQHTLITMNPGESEPENSLNRTYRNEVVIVHAR
jgi:hypothetical protein